LLFRSGIQDQYTKRLNDSNPESREAAMLLVHDWQQEEKTSTANTLPPLKVCEVQEKETTSEGPMPEEAVDQIMAAFQKKFGFNKNNSYSKGSGSSKPNNGKPKITCYYCKKLGHTQAECYTKARDEKNGKTNHKPYQKKVNDVAQGNDNPDNRVYSIPTISSQGDKQSGFL
jgi:hypothetical protein